MGFSAAFFAQDAWTVGGQAGDRKMVSLALCPRSLKSVYLLAWLFIQYPRKSPCVIGREQYWRNIFSRDVTVFREIARVRVPVVWWCLPDL